MDDLKHHGVKGMRWGIRRYQPYPKGKGHKGKFLGKTARKVADAASTPYYAVKSKAREVSMLTDIRKSHGLSTKEIQRKARRMKNESEYKRLTRIDGINLLTGTTSSKSRMDYRKRGNMSDQELERKVKRLKSIELLTKNAYEINEETIKTGSIIAQTAKDVYVDFKKDGDVKLDKALASYFKAEDKVSRDMSKTKKRLGIK